MVLTEKGENKANRQCWDCIKRRLVCDRTLAHCRKCQKAGRQCSGYDDTKPLQWVETGMVTSRRRRKKDSGPPKAYIVTPATCQNRQLSLQGDVESGKEIYDCLFENVETDYIYEPVDFKDTLAGYMSIQRSQAQEGLPELHVSSLKHAALAREAGWVLKTWGRAKVEEVVRNESHEEAARILRTKREPLKRLKRMIDALERLEVPSYTHLSNDTSEVVQAVHYYNVRIHPEWKAQGELAPNPAIVIFPPQALHLLTPAIHHTLVCISLSHFVHTQPSGTNSAVTCMNRSKIYQHRGEALRSLSQYIAQDKTRCSDMTITSILMFMCLELQNPSFTDWRSHVNGMKRLIDVRGGPKQLMEDAPHLLSSLVLYLLIISMANTCSPSWDQLDITGANRTIIEDVKSVYDLIFPYTLCPQELFIEILEINQLRTKAAASMLLYEADPAQALEAHDLVSRIERFSPENWAQGRLFFSEWVLLGKIYKAAVSLYCTMSLQSLTLLPPTMALQATQIEMADELRSDVRSALKRPRLARHMVWPLVVAGVEAIHGGQATQNWIEVTLCDLSIKLGTSCPLKACTVLKRYWRGGVAGWDECFDRPYVFII